MIMVIKIKMDKLDDDELSTTERNQYILKSRLSLKTSRLTLGEDYAEFILQRTPHKTHSGTDTILEGMHSKFSNGGLLKIVAGNGKGENGNGGNIVMQGGSRFSLTAGNNLFRITDPRDKSTSEITILKRGSIKNITVYDNSIDVPQLQLSPTFESGSRSFSVHTNNSHIVLNVHSEWGTCKLIKDDLEYTNCTNNTLASLMFGLNAYKIHHSIDGVYDLNIYRGSNVLSITLTAYGEEGNKIEPNIPLIPSFPYHRLVTNQFHAFLYVAAYDDDDKEDPFFC
jgi:hypothetical protein